MTYLPEVRAQLEGAIGHTADPRWGRARQRGGRMLLWGAPATLTLAILAVALLLALHGRGTERAPAAAARPTSQPPALRWRQDSAAAADGVAKHDPRCYEPISQGLKSPQVQRVSEGVPPRTLTTGFSAFRHPASAGAAISVDGLRQLGVDADDIYLRFARQGVVDGVRYAVIPVGQLEPGRVRCPSAQLAAFRHLLAGAPSAQQAQAVAFERRLLAGESAGYGPGVVLLDRGAGGDGATFLTLKNLRHFPFASGSDGSDSITRTLLLVPDAVATVSARYPTQTRPGRVTSSITVTRHAENNFVMFVLRGAWDPPSLTFRSATGRVLAGSSRG